MEEKMISVSDANKLIDIVKREVEYEAQCKLNRIASSLKVDYLDLLSAKDDEMTVELGECLRDLMFDMFKRLKKEGVDVESRI